MQLYERRPSYTIRVANREDLPRLCELETLCWGESFRDHSSVIAKRLDVFPEGQLVLEETGNGLVAGVVYCQRISDPRLLYGRTWNDLIGIHEPEGQFGQLIKVCEIKCVN